MYEWVTAIISAVTLSASSSACCHGLLIITVITPLPTKPSDKNARELKLANAAITDMQMRHVMLLRARCKIHEGVSRMRKLKMMLCVMMPPLVVVGCTSKQSVSQCVKPSPPPAWIMQPPPDWQTPLNGIISPSERGWSLCKNNWKGTWSILMSSADRVGRHRWATCNYCEQYTRRFQRSINA